MKRSSALLSIALLLLVCGPEKQNPGVRSLNVDRLWPVRPKQPENKTATSDDPGPTETVISPLSILKEQAIPSRIKPEPEEDARREPMPVDHRVDVPSQKPENILHKVFSINKYAQFPFVAPPHQGNTRLRGTFRSFTKRNNPDSSDSTADVDLLLLNEQEFNEFLHGQPQSITYELDSAHNQMVDWRVPTTYETPQTYHLVFSNSGETKPKFVEADFTVTSE
jgi:hypothetical protein